MKIMGVEGELEDILKGRRCIKYTTENKTVC